MKRTLLLVILLLCIGVAGYTFYTAWRMQDPSFQRQRTLGDARMIENPAMEVAQIDLDEFAKIRPQKDGSREIKFMEPIVFSAAVREAPKPISTSYLKEVFGVIGLNPMPQVNHRMFVESQAGAIIPVYVWDEVATRFEQSETPQQMTGYHAYTYAKGPAIIVDGMI